MYDAYANLSGYIESVQTGIVITLGDITTVDFVLEVSSGVGSIFVTLTSSDPAVYINLFTGVTLEKDGVVVQELELWHIDDPSYESLYQLTIVNFSIDDLETGDYTLSLVPAGFEEVSNIEVQVVADQETSVEIELVPTVEE